MSQRSNPSADESVSQANRDAKHPIRNGVWVLLLGFCGLITWAAVAPLDEGVPTPATVVVDTRRHVIQHQTGGVVRSVAVREGQTVRRGELLIDLDDGAAVANYQAVRQAYMALRAAESRLLAEQTGRTTVVFHADLLAARQDPQVQQHMATQTELFNARRRALLAEIRGSHEQIAGLESQLAGAKSRVASRQQQLDLQDEQLANVRELATKGYAPRNQVLSLAQSRAELTAVMAEIESSRERDLHAIADLKHRVEQRQQDFLKESNAQLADVRREVEAGQDKLKASAEELARLKINAPVDGQVVGLGVSTVGGVVSPGQRLMEVVPADAKLLLDAKIAPQVIDRVRLGSLVDVRFSAFANSPQLVVQARLVSVSGDALSEQQGNMVATYYLGRAELTPEGLRELGGRAIQPGMQAELLIKGGERTLLTYLLHPLTKRLGAAMREE